MQIPPILPIKSFAKTPKSNSLKEHLGIGNSLLDAILKLSAVSIVIGAFVAHHYLKTIGFAYLFPTIIGSQGGLLMIVFGLGFAVFGVFSLLSATPWFAIQARDLAHKNFSSESLFTFRHLLLLFVAAPTLLYLFMEFVPSRYATVWAILLFQGILAILWLLSSRESAAFILRACRRPWSASQREPFLSSVAMVIITWVAVLFSIFPWLFALSLIKTEIPNVTDQDLYGKITIPAWIILYGTLCSGLVSREERKPGDTAKAIAGAILAVILALLFNVPGTFVKAAMYVASLRENPGEAKLYAVDKAAYKKLMPGINRIPSHKFSADGDLYICAYSPFLYVDKKILCDPSVTSPNAQECVVMNDSEARVVLAPPQSFTGIGKCAPGESSAKSPEK